MKKKVIIIKPNYKHRVPHKPTQVHKSQKKYDRKRSKRELKEELKGGTNETT